MASIIDLTSEGKSSSIVDLGTILVRIVTYYNYSSECWIMDILDLNDNPILHGLMLVPNIDVLEPYTEEKLSLGSLVLVELNAGDYKSPDDLGTKTKLIWYPVGEEVVLPV